MAAIFQGSGLGRVFSGAGSAGPRRLALIGGVAAVALCVIGVVMIRGHHQGQRSSVAALPDVNALPGGMHSNPYYNQLATQQAQQQAQAAAAKGQSSVAPMAPGVPAGPVAPAPAVARPAPTETVTARPAPPAHLQPTPVAYAAPPAAQQPQQPTPEQKQQNQLYAAAVDSLLAGWGNGPPPVTQVYIDPNKEGGTGGPAGGTGAHAEAQPVSSSATGRAANRDQGAPTAPPATVLIPAGKGVYARTKLAANSDTGGPVVVTAESGPIAGDDMMGTFSRRDDRLVVNLTSITLQDGEQKSLDALVIAPELDGDGGCERCRSALRRAISAAGGGCVRRGSRPGDRTIQRNGRSEPVRRLHGAEPSEFQSAARRRRGCGRNAAPAALPAERA